MRMSRGYIYVLMDGWRGFWLMSRHRGKLHLGVFSIQRQTKSNRIAVDFGSSGSLVALRKWPI